jgi:hypothetical protein
VKIIQFVCVLFVHSNWCASNVNISDYFFSLFNGAVSFSNLSFKTFAKTLKICTNKKGTIIKEKADANKWLVFPESKN